HALRQVVGGARGARDLPRPTDDGAEHQRDHRRRAARRDEGVSAGGYVSRGQPRARQPPSLAAAVVGVGRQHQVIVRRAALWRARLVAGGRLLPALLRLREQWDQLVRVASSVLNKTAPAHVIMQRLQQSPDGLARALAMLGRIVKTAYIVRYASDP